MSEVQAPFDQGSSAKVVDARGVSLHAAPLPGMILEPSGVQAPTDPTYSAEVAGVREVSLHAAPTPWDVSESEKHTIPVTQASLQRLLVSEVPVCSPTLELQCQLLHLLTFK